MKLQLAFAPDVTPRNPDSLTAQLGAMRQREACAPAAIWEPPVAPAAPAAPAIAIPGEAAMIDVITRPVGPSEGHADGNARKERELMTLFDALTPVEALTVRRRLSAMRAGDALAAAFQRLVVDRRARLLAFLDDTRRRIARRAG